MPVKADSERTRLKWQFSLRSLFLLVFVVAVALMVLRWYYPSYLRAKTIATCEANRESVLPQKGLPQFEFVTSQYFKDTDGKRYQAMVFESFSYLSDVERIVKVVVVDRSYSVLQSNIITRLRNRSLTGESKLVYRSTKAVLIIEISGSSMEPSKIQMPITVSHKPEAITIWSQSANSQ